MVPSAAPEEPPAPVEPEEPEEVTPAPQNEGESLIADDTEHPTECPEPPIQSPQPPPHPPAQADQSEDAEQGELTKTIN